MHSMKVSKSEGWKPVFTAEEACQILVVNTGGGRVRLALSEGQPASDSYRGREIGYGEIPAFFMVPASWTVWGRVNRLSEWVTLEAENFNTPSEIENIIAALRQEMEAQTSNDNTALTNLINTEINNRVEALTAEVVARNAAIQSAFNTEATARTAADNLEGNTRSAADIALASRASALESSRTRKYAQNIGNGILTTFDIDHNLGTTDVVVQTFSGSTLSLITPQSVQIMTANRVPARAGCQRLPRGGSGLKILERARLPK